MIRQMYDYYVKPYLGEKGQDLVEYALLLAIVVGIGYLIWDNAGIKASLTTIFSNADEVTSKAATAASSGAASSGAASSGST